MKPLKFVNPKPEKVHLQAEPASNKFVDVPPFAEWKPGQPLEPFVVEGAHFAQYVHMGMLRPFREEAAAVADPVVADKTIEPAPVVQPVDDVKGTDVVSVGGGEAGHSSEDPGAAQSESGVVEPAPGTSEAGAGGGSAVAADAGVPQPAAPVDDPQIPPATEEGGTQAAPPPQARRRPGRKSS